MIFNYFQVLNGFRVLCSNLFALMYILLKRYKVLAFEWSEMVFVCRKLFLKRKNLCLSKTTFIKEKKLGKYVCRNFFCRKFP